ncbi:hypothetical protein AOLI_G00280720 [Acnodon oligacanthus]
MRTGLLSRSTLSWLQSCSYSAPSHCRRHGPAIGWQETLLVSGWRQPGSVVRWPRWRQRARSRLFKGALHVDTAEPSNTL